MLEVLTRNWWTLALRGALAIAFGVLAFLWPGLTLLALVILFAAYALSDGILSIVGGIRTAKRSERWWLMVLGGVLGIVAGVLAIVWPAITAIALLALIAAWAIVTGVFQVFAAYRLRRLIEGERLLALAGVASVAFGILMFVFPTAGALAVVWVIAAYAIAYGVLLLTLAFRLRSRTERQDGRSAPFPAQRQPVSG